LPGQGGADQRRVVQLRPHPHKPARRRPARPAPDIERSPITTSSVRLTELEKKEAAILYLDGYADDMGEMSTSLQGLGEVSLKSTSRRNNKNYFQMEITLP